MRIFYLFCFSCSAVLATDQPQLQRTRLNKRDLEIYQSEDGNWRSIKKNRPTNNVQQKNNRLTTQIMDIEKKNQFDLEKKNLSGTNSRKLLSDGTFPYYDENISEIQYDIKNLNKQEWDKVAAPTSSGCCSWLRNLCRKKYSPLEKQFVEENNLLSESSESNHESYISYALADQIIHIDGIKSKKSCCSWLRNLCKKNPSANTKNNQNEDANRSEQSLEDGYFLESPKSKNRLVHKNYIVAQSYDKSDSSNIPSISSTSNIVRTGVSDYVVSIIERKIVVEDPNPLPQTYWQWIFGVKPIPQQREMIQSHVQLNDNSNESTQKNENSSYSTEFEFTQKRSSPDGGTGSYSHKQSSPQNVLISNKQNLRFQSKESSLVSPTILKKIKDHEPSDRYEQKRLKNDSFYISSNNDKNAMSLVSSSQNQNIHLNRDSETDNHFVYNIIKNKNTIEDNTQFDDENIIITSLNDTSKFYDMLENAKKQSDFKNNNH